MPTLSGTVKDSTGAFASRLVRVYRRDNGQLVGQTLSNGTTGAWSITTLDTSEHFALMHDGTPVTADSSFSNVVLLSHFEGANGATTIVDEKGNRLAANGNAQLSTAFKKTGSTSALFAGPGDWIQTTGNLDNFVFGTGDFTIEFSVKTSGNNRVLLDYYTSGLAGWQVYLTSGGLLNWYTNASIKTGSIAINTNTWKDIAIVRSSGNLYFFVDGTLDGSATAHSQDLNAQIAVFAIGAQVASRNAIYDFSGYIDELRITKGVARYTASYTPTSGAFPGDVIASGGAENAVIYDRLVPV